MTSESDSPKVQPPEWFTAFQREMGRLLRTPLDVREGHFRAAVEDYPQTLTKRLRHAVSFSLLRLDLELPVGQRADDFAFSTAPRKTPAHVAIAPSSRGIATYPLDPVFARLLALARVCTLGKAAARTEKSLPGSLREHLATSMDGYIDAALRNGFWLGAG